MQSQDVCEDVVVSDNCGEDFHVSEEVDNGLVTSTNSFKGMNTMQRFLYKR